VSDVCLIVDANTAGVLLAKPSVVIDWLFGDRGNPRLVAAGRLRVELATNQEVRRQLVELDRAGRLRSADPQELRQEEGRLHADGTCISNDRHILALAIVSGARTLATDDNRLASDFTNAKIINRPRGKVYRDPQRHAHLLRHTPKSCGVDNRTKRRH
jgi:hypothetical protein